MSTGINTLIEEGDNLFTEGRFQAALSKWEIAIQQCANHHTEEIQERIDLAKQQINHTLRGANVTESKDEDTIKEATINARFDVLASIWESEAGATPVERLLFKAESVFREAQSNRDRSGFEEAIRIWQAVLNVDPDEKKAQQGIEEAKFEIRALEAIGYKSPKKRSTAHAASQEGSAQISDLLTSADLNFKQGQAERNPEKIRKAGQVWQSILEKDPLCEEANAGLQRVRRILGESWAKENGYGSNKLDSSDSTPKSTHFASSKPKNKEAVPLEPIEMSCRNANEFLQNYLPELPGLVLFTDLSYSVGNSIILQIYIEDRDMALSIKGEISNISNYAGSADSSTQRKVEIRILNLNGQLQSQIDALRKITTLPNSYARKPMDFKRTSEETVSKSDRTNKRVIEIPLESLRIVGEFLLSGSIIALFRGLETLITSKPFALTLREAVISLFVVLGFQVGERLWAKEASRMRRLAKGALAATLVVLFASLSSCLNWLLMLNTLKDLGFPLIKTFHSLLFVSGFVYFQGLIAFLVLTFIFSRGKK